MKIWVDLDNTPHVPFFRPILLELEARGHTIFLTARDAFQVYELADRAELAYTKVGRHYGKRRLSKIWGLGWRTLQLVPHILRERPALGLSHGSRSQILLCNLLRIPSVMIMDYEFVRTPGPLRPRWEIVPEAMANADLHCTSRARVRTYRGIKEDVYAPDFVPDPSLTTELGLRDSEIVVTIRPPANEAHYHQTETDTFFVAFMDRLIETPGVHAVLLPRNRAQDVALRQAHANWFKNGSVTVPKRAVDGLNLLWHSDLVVGAGGTMNREAAALGVPVYSLFRGPTGEVDRYLAREGKLVLIESLKEVEEKVHLRHRDRGRAAVAPGRTARQEIVEHIEAILRSETGKR